MFCSQCGQKNPDGARFCGQCGAALPASQAAQTRAAAPSPPPSLDHGFGPPPPPSFDDGPVAAAPSFPRQAPSQVPPYGPPPTAQPTYSAPGYGPPPPPTAATPSWGPPSPAAGPPPPPAATAPSWGPPPPSAAGLAPAYAPGGYGAGYAAAPAMEYKGVMPRFFAAIIDGILTGLAMTVLTALLGGGMDPEALASGDFAYALGGAPALLIIVVGWGYPILFEGLFGGTIGKKILGMRVVNAEGQNAGLGRALVRNLLRIIDALPFAYILGAVMVASSDTKQRLGDRVAGTYVVAR